jgi:uncharacterized membrane protein YsdA (DUF1294 family)
MARWAWMMVAGAYATMSLITFAYYGLDKRRAGRGGWRIPEKTLHLLELLGGFPGALLAQSLFRHKRSKTSYMLVFWLIVALHAAGWIGGYLLIKR